ncbi:hypothetical protein [Sphingomonas sp.]|uniref:hypothetical protein n=1 Tax=Sphingomonas sp. TaxID=28214 RepID=UPI0035A9581F
MSPQIPHLNIVVAFAIAAVAGYAGFSLWIMWRNEDAALIGDVLGTWKSFAVLAFGFWMGSSSGGKAKDAAKAEAPSGTPADPVSVHEVAP